MGNVALRTQGEAFRLLISFFLFIRAILLENRGPPFYFPHLYFYPCVFLFPLYQLDEKFSDFHTVYTGHSLQHHAYEFI